MQACSSKLCNFHLPSLVSFVNKLFFCLVPKYLELPVLKNIFCKKKLFVSWGRPHFLLFYLNFGPLLHLHFMKIHIDAFPQSCRYSKVHDFQCFVADQGIKFDARVTALCNCNFKKLFVQKLSAENELLKKKDSF